MGTEGDNVRVIGGRYRFEARIGRGGMGVVWRATDTLLARQVAVKELGVELEPEPELGLGPGGSLSEDDARRRRERMLREARAVAQLQHPNIIVVHDVVLHDEHPYIVMELVNGGSLADRIARQGPVDATEAARIGLALLGALRVAHAAGVLHRDLKPANVLLEQGTGRVVLTDFGIAQVEGASTLTETGGFVGSPEYTAPERMAGEGAGAGADLWSLGVLLLAALTGESPFRRDSLGGTLHAVVYEEIRPSDAAEPLLPVIQGLLQREPDRRLGLDEAERLLRAYVATGATPQPAVPYGADLPRAGYPPARPAAPPAAARRVLSTRVLLVAAALVAALVGAAIAVAVLLSQQGTGDNTPPATTSPASRRPSASASVSPTPTVTVTRRETRTETASASVPAGYRVADDPEGFRLAVPEGFRRETDGPRIFYMSPGRAFRIGIKVADTESGGPGAAQRRSAADGPRNNPGYRSGKVTDTTHDGRAAALWEFTWNGFSAAEGARHTVDLCWEQGGRMYDVWVSSPVGEAGRGRAHFDAAVDTFVPSAGD
ncbi:serine/threonine-protein kinase [Streptomyces sp. NPDC046716]|uniref:serine/threonine-protein kinase n=1 Tax=Streptomyces sp. NPDC046716 TaxID=3157093 RepID=UPI00340F678A